MKRRVNMLIILHSQHTGNVIKIMVIIIMIIISNLYCAIRH